MPEKFKDLLEEFRLQIPVDNKGAIEVKFGAEEGLLHDLLREVDPKMAEYFHSKDRRRVINALFKALKDRKESEVVKEEKALRYYPVLIWMRAAPDILEERIWKRIGQMIGEMGGLDEI